MQVAFIHAAGSIFLRRQVIYDYPSIREVHLICNLTTLGVVAPLGYNGLLILSCTFYAFKVLFYFSCILVPFTFRSGCSLL